MNLVLDWAGTLADDQVFTGRLTDEVIRSFGGAGVSFETYRREFTLPAQGFYARYCPGASWDAIEESFAALCRARYPAAVRLWPGIKEAIGGLTRHHRLYLFTSLDQGMIESSLESLGLRHHFLAVKGSVQDKAVEMPAWIRSLGLAQDETVAVGDMPHDITAAHAAGIQAAAVEYGYGSPEALAAAGPEDRFRDVPGLLRHFDKLSCAESRHFPVATVGGLIEDDQGRILLVKTRKWSGLYGIPGGKIDYGESMEAAFVREVREETGLAIKDVTFVMNQDCIEHPQFYRPRHYILVNYRCRVSGSRPAVKLNHESEHWVWASPAEALAMALNAPTRILIERVLAGGSAPSSSTTTERGA